METLRDPTGNPDAGDDFTNDNLCRRMIDERIEIERAE